MLIAVCCDRGAPGSTTTALALGVASAEPTVVVEADPYGGDMVLRCQLLGGGAMPERPTVATVAEAARTASDPEWLRSLGHEFSPSTRLVPGYLSAEHAAGVADWRALAHGLKSSSSRVVADLGRIHSASPSLSIAAAADVVVVVTRPDMGSLRHLVERVERLTPALVAEARKAPVLFPVVVAPKRTGAALAAQIAARLATSQVSMSVAGTGFLAWDEPGVALMEHGRITGRDAKTPLMQTATQLVAQIADLNPAAHRQPGVTEQPVEQTASEPAPASPWSTPPSPSSTSTADVTPNTNGPTRQWTQDRAPRPGQGLNQGINPGAHQGRAVGEGQ